MKKYLVSNLGRFRALAFLEGTSLLILVFIGMPLKYWMEAEGFVKVLGPIHGVLFILYVVFAIIVARTSKWQWFTVVLVFLASFIPFGTFVVDRKILSGLHGKELEGHSAA